MRISDFIPHEKMLEIMCDFVSMGVKAVTFSGGGEPTMYPWLDEAAWVLAENNIKFAMLTNGARFEGDVAQVFADHGSWVRVSIDGWDRKSYKMYRGVDDFDRVVRNIKSFRSLRCLIGVNIVVTRHNAGHIYDIVNLLADSISTVKISPCVMHDNVKQNLAYHSKISKVVKEQLRRVGESFDMPINDTYFEQMHGFKKAYSWCPSIQIQPVVGADCNIYTCHDKAYDLPGGLLGSFKDKSFCEVWYAADKFAVRPSRDCRHHCMAHIKNQTILNYLDIYDDHKEFA
jgi:sulfatase maturation enzyme AslB (radical SAM superfamily)